MLTSIKLKDSLSTSIKLELNALVPITRVVEESVILF